MARNTLLGKLALADVRRSSIEGLCVPGVLSAVVQPVVRLSDMSIVGYEALARMPLHPHKGPYWWLERATELNMRQRLEVACWRTIIDLGPPPNDLLLFLNVSPATLAEPDLLALRDRLPERVAIEVTEQEAVADYERLRRDLVPWLAKNTRLAIDDAGSGHSSLRHVIELVPDFIKIDQSLIHGIDADRNRRALVHSLVAFAREVGITVIAEGIETRQELEVVREAGVNLVQGYLLAPPAPAWSCLELRNPANRRSSQSIINVTSTNGAEGEHAWLRERLASADSAHSACEAVVEFLYRHGQLMPSIYLEFEGQLRCIAQRGLWQVLDGMSGTAGITGKTWSSGIPTVVSDVRVSKEYLEAIPGVISEICVPIANGGEVIGALNVESLTTLGDDTLNLLQSCTELLVDRLNVVDWRERDLPWRRAARALTKVSRLDLDDQTHKALVEILRESSEMDSACLLHCAGTAPKVLVAAGPLGPVLAALPEDEMADLARLVDNVSSCYTANDTLGRGFVGTESIRSFARAVIVLPLRTGNSRVGTIVLANSCPKALFGEFVEPLELIVGQFGAILDAAALVKQLRQEAYMDTLTGLGNRAAFEKELAKEAGRSGLNRRAALIIDVDCFKEINDHFGHFTGDEALRSLGDHFNAPRDLQVFRYGGDEFACFIPNYASDVAIKSAELLCKSTGSLLAHYGSSVSAGLALPASNESPWKTFERADEALLRAKRHFKGNVVLSTVIDSRACPE